MKAGIYPGITRAEYDKIDAINISTLIHGERSMAHLKYFIEHPSDEKTDSLEFGIAGHIAVFEPSEFQKRVKKGPDVRRNTNEWKDFVKAAGPTVTVLKPDDFDRCLEFRDALRKHELVKEILDARGVGEMAVVWRDEKTGLLCKGMLDRFCEWRGWPLVPDLKSTQDASLKEFQKDVVNYHYATKASWYLDGMYSIAKASRRFFWIAVESKPPHEISIYEPTEDALADGRKKYRKLLDGYAHGLKTGEWLGYPSGIEPLDLPRWAKERIVFE